MQPKDIIKMQNASKKFYSFHVPNALKSIKIRQMSRGIIAVMLDETMMRRETARNSTIEGVMLLVAELRRRYDPARIRLNLFYSRIFPRAIWSGMLNEEIPNDIWGHRIARPHAQRPN